jgi:hypothetical protein
MITASLPLPIIQIILLERAKLWLKDIVASNNLDYDALIDMLQDINGNIFGSVVLSSLLNTHNYNDLDILHRKTENKTVRDHIERIAGERTPHERERYAPIDFCDDCCSVLGIRDRGKYHRTHTTKDGFVIDMTEVDNEPNEYLKHRAFNTDTISFDGENFRFQDNSPEFLIKFVCRPSFSIERLQCLEFERPYDGWGEVCSVWNSPNEDETEEDRWPRPALRRKCHGKKYDCAAAMDGGSLEERMLGRLKSVRLSLNEQNNPLKWIVQHLFKPVDELQEICVQRYIGKEDPTSYRVLKIVLRILKHTNRGILCRNAADHFDVRVSENDVKKGKEEYATQAWNQAVKELEMSFALKNLSPRQQKAVDQFFAVSTSSLTTPHNFDISHLPDWNEMMSQMFSKLMKFHEEV